MLSSTDPSNNVAYKLASLSLSDYTSDMNGGLISKKKSAKTMMLKAFSAQEPTTTEGKDRIPVPSRKYSNKPSVLQERQANVVTSTDPMESVEAYFIQHGGGAGRGRAKTSSRTLSTLHTDGKSKLLDPLTMEHVLKNEYKPIQSTVSTRLQIDLSNRLFSKWPHYLREGFNLLLYGVGSKRTLIDRFREKNLAQSNCIVIPGFECSITIRHVLNAICHELLQVEEKCKNPSEQLDFITELFSRVEAANSPLFLLVHNIDGPGLRNAKAQAVLAHLASVPYIHLIASVDHANIPILWSHIQLSRFRWIWEDCTSLTDYTSETNFTNSPLLQNILGGIMHSGGLAGYSGQGTMLASLRQVAASLTQNARDIFRLIAQHQLSAPFDGGSASDIGMPLEDLYWQCRDAFLTNSEATLRIQLTEFRDHKLLKIKKGVDGTEFLFIPMDRSNLEKFLLNFDTFC